MWECFVLCGVWGALVVCFALAVQPIYGLNRRVGRIYILVLELKLILWNSFV